MKVRIEDLATNKIRDESFPLRNLTELQSFLIAESRKNGLGFYVLRKGRGKFLEVSSPGGKLLERYTRTDQ